MRRFHNSFQFLFFPRYVCLFLPTFLQKCLVILLPDIPITKEAFFYETVHGNFVAIINEEKSFNSDEWTCAHHIMIPKKFLHLFSKLSLKNSKKDEELNIKYLSYLTNSGKYTDPDEPLALQVDISTLSKPVKKNFV